MFIRLSFDIYKPNLKGEGKKKPCKNILSIILFVWNCSNLGYKTKPELLKWEIN